MDVRKILGANVRKLRLSAKLSQEELAARIGMAQHYVSQLETGKRNPTVLTLALISQALGVPISKLFTSPRKS